MEEPSQLRNVVFFLALLSTALAMGAALAHALELPNKIGLSREHYFIVQRSYDGWNQLAYLLVIELLTIIGVIMLYWPDVSVRWLAVTALAFLIMAQILFWTFTYPANAATANWTTIPEGWEVLRTQWEYSHLAGAALQTLAMSALIAAALARTR
jgi:hypothetical protein